MQFSFMKLLALAGIVFLCCIAWNLWQCFAIASRTFLRSIPGILHLSRKYKRSTPNGWMRFRRPLEGNLACNRDN